MQLSNVKQMMKSKKIAIVAALLLGTAGMAGLSKVSELNAAIAKLVAQYNYKGSKVSLVVSKAEVNAERAVALQGKIVVKKVGQSAAGALKGDVSYSYPVRADAIPVLSFSAELDARHGNMTKILNNLGVSEDEVRRLFVETEKSVHESANEILKTYGDAATVVVKVKHSTKDKAGNYRDLALQLDVKLDLTKLPANIKPEAVLLLAAKMDVDLDLDRGFSVKGKVLMNKNYTSFRSDEVGLKEYVEALLKQDPAAMAELSGIAMLGNMLMDQAVGNHPLGSN